jgi:flavin reductase (DIM6/NTAB) family NADH-FMN oxidoreductase RutF
MPVTAAEFRKALGHFATGVTVVTVGRPAGQVHGMTANAFASVSLDPLLVLVCVDRKARTHPLIHEQKRFGINVLTDRQERLARYFAQVEQDHESAHRLGVSYWRTESGTPMLGNCLAHLECRLVSEHEAGDHTIFLGEVEHAQVGKGRPLLFFAGKYHRLPSRSR